MASNNNGELSLKLERQNVFIVINFNKHVSVCVCACVFILEQDELKYISYGLFDSILNKCSSPMFEYYKM